MGIGGKNYTALICRGFLLVFYVNFKPFIMYKLYVNSIKNIKHNQNFHLIQVIKKRIQENVKSI